MPRSLWPHVTQGRASAKQNRAHGISRVVRRRLPWTLDVREGGVEPPRPFGHTDLNRARLPIPPLARAPEG